MAQDPCHFDRPQFGLFQVLSGRGQHHPARVDRSFLAFVAIVSVTWVVYGCGRSGSSGPWRQLKDLRLH